MARTADLKRNVKDWLDSDSSVQSHLGADGEVLPMSRAAQSDADPLVAFAVSQPGGQRNNQREEKTFEIRVSISATFSYVETNGTIPLDDVKGAVKDVLMAKREGWTEPQLVEDEDFQPHSDLNRHLAVSRFTVERTDQHAYYQ